MAYGTINADVIQSSVSGVSLGAGNATVFKNRIINGDMRIDQRNAGASVTPTNGQYVLDRWILQSSQTSKFTAQQNAGAVTPPAGFINYLGITSSSAYSVLAGDYFVLSQRVEGLNIADLAWGTANAKAVTLSFWVYSSLTGTFGGSIVNEGSPSYYSYPFTYTISSANTWTQISITISGPTSGTWLTTNGIGLRPFFGLGVGTTYSGTAGTWASSNYLSATGATSVVGTSGATFYITGVQLEVGSSATGFEYVNYGTQLAMCQRYYEMSYPQGTAVGTATQNNAVFAYINGVSTITGSAFWVKYSQVKRTSPTVTTYSTANTNTSGVMTSAANGTNYSTTISANSDSSFGAYWTQGASSLNATMQWTASAEL